MPSIPSFRKTDADSHKKANDEVRLKIADVHPKEAIDPVAERKLLKKMDVFLIPLMGFIYLLCFLDRGNIGNAYTAGMATALDLNANEKAAAVSVVYATYVAFECVWPTLIKLLTVKFTMTFAVLGFGVLTIGTAFVKNFSQLAACRVLLGVTEAGVFPCIVVYLSMTYKREELAVRLSYIMLCAAISGAFGGLIAFGLSHITSGSLAAWQWIYLIEGILTVAIAPVVWFWIPNRADQSWFLNAAERRMVTIRYESKDMHYSPDEYFNWRDIRRALTNWTTYAHGVAQFAIDIALWGISTFMPVFIRAFGYGTLESQLLTVPVYVVGALSFMIQAPIADKMKLRGPFILANMGVCLIGYIVQAAVARPPGVRYFALFIITIGLYLPVGLNVGWTQASNARHYQRALSVGVMQLIGNSSGAAIGYIFKDSPRFAKGFSIAAALCAFGMLAIIILMWHYRRENARKRILVSEGAADEPELGNDNPHFMYYI